MIDEETKQYLRRIAEAVESISYRLHPKRVHTDKARTAENISGAILTKGPRAELDNRRATGNRISQIIGVYIKAWQNRYGTRARPALSGKEQGILKRIVKERGEEKTNALLQVYCQMQDEWFTKKRHDLATFEANIGKVDLALHAGHENTHINMTRIFGGQVAVGNGGTYGQEPIPDTNRPDEKDLGGTQLPGGETGHVLEEFLRDPN